MKLDQAKSQLRYALRNQKTISIPKLQEILQSMNFSFEDNKSKEVKYLRGEIKKLNQLKVLRVKKGVPTKIKYDGNVYALVHGDYANGNKRRGGE
jgi:hypothetical protein